MQSCIWIDVNVRLHFILKHGLSLTFLYFLQQEDCVDIST